MKVKYYRAVRGDAPHLEYLLSETWIRKTSVLKILKVKDKRSNIWLNQPKTINDWKIVTRATDCELWNITKEEYFAEIL